MIQQIKKNLNLDVKRAIDNKTEFDRIRFCGNRNFMFQLVVDSLPNENREKSRNRRKAVGNVFQKIKNGDYVGDFLSGNTTLSMFVDNKLPNEQYELFFERRKRNNK